MPYKVFTAGEEALASDANTYLMSQTVPRFTNAAQRTSQLTAPVLNQLSMLDTAAGVIQHWNGAAWADIRGASAAAVAAGEATGSATYVDLTTPGPAASIITGALALVTLSTRFLGGAVGYVGLLGFAVSGASSVAAADGSAVFMPALSASNSSDHSRQFLVSGLTPGLNTFTAKYRVSGGSCTFTNRVLSVQAL